MSRTSFRLKTIQSNYVKETVCSILKLGSLKCRESDLRSSTVCCRMISFYFSTTLCTIIILIYYKSIQVESKKNAHTRRMGIFDFKIIVSTQITYIYLCCQLSQLLPAFSAAIQRQPPGAWLRAFLS